MKYRLIKSYPGSPKLGTCVTIQNGRVFYEDTCHILPIDCDIVVFPEFWEPVDELEKEILKIINEQIVVSRDGTLCRYAPEYAAKLICELVKDTYE